MVWLWNGGRLLDAKKRLGRCGVWGRDRKKKLGGVVWGWGVSLG